MDPNATLARMRALLVKRRTLLDAAGFDGYAIVHLA